MEDWPPTLQVFGFALRDWWDDWVNMVVINVIWVLCWLTIVLGPPATFGVYYVTHNLAYGQSLGPRGMLEGARRYFLQSWLWFLLNIVVAMLLTVNFFFYGNLEIAFADYVRMFFVLMAFLWLIIQFYTLPYMMEQEEKTLRHALRNGLFTFLAAPGYTLVVAGGAYLLLGLSVTVLAPLFLGVPCLVTAIGNRAVRERLEAFGLRERPEPPEMEDKAEE